MADTCGEPLGCNDAGLPASVVEAASYVRLPDGPAGELRFAKRLVVSCDETGNGGGGGGTVAALTRSITLNSHGFSVGDVLKKTSGSYAKAQADSVSNAEVVGIVSAVADANTFTLTYAGRVTGLSGLTDATVYFLSASSAGALTATEPSASGQVSKPLLIADGTTSGVFLNQRGELQP